MSNIQLENVQDLVEKWLKQEREGKQFPVPFDLAWEIAGYSQKHHGKRKLTAKTSPLIEGEDYLTQSGEWSQGGRSSDSIYLTCDGFKHFCLMAKTEAGRQIRQYFIEAEKKWRMVQEQHPNLAQEIEAQRLKNQGLELEKQKQETELKLLQFRHTVTQTCPEPIQQKVLGYSTVEKVEYRDRVIKDDDVVRDGSTLNKTELCQRYGILTRNGKPDYKRLNQLLSRLPEEAWDEQISIRQNHEVKREYLDFLDHLVFRSDRQINLGEAQ